MQGVFNVFWSVAIEVISDVFRTLSNICDHFSHRFIKTKSIMAHVRSPFLSEKLDVLL